MNAVNLIPDGENVAVTGENRSVVEDLLPAVNFTSLLQLVNL